MRKIKARLVRFLSGGLRRKNDWRDGIGPGRQTSHGATNLWSDGEESVHRQDIKYRSNQFGTIEFVHFCKLIADSTLLAPVRSFRRRILRWGNTATLPRPPRPGGHARVDDVGAPSTFGLGSRKRVLGCRSGLNAAKDYAMASADSPTAVPQLRQACPSLRSDLRS